MAARPRRGASLPPRRTTHLHRPHRDAGGHNPPCHKGRRCRSTPCADVQRPQHRRFAAIFLPALFVCFLGGAAFAYFVMLPTGLKFLLHFGAGVAVPVITITEYLSLLTALMFWLGVVFNLPLAMFLLAKLRVVSYRRFRSFRKFVPVTAFILSALITPTFDIINQTMVAVPIIMLYEVGLFLAWIARPEEGSRRVLTKIRSVIVGILRRFAVLVALPLAVLLGLLYMIALFGVFVYDGHLSTEMRSKGKGRLDRAYRKATKTIAKVLFLVRAGWMENE